MARKKKQHDLDLNRDFLNPTGKTIAEKLHANKLTLTDLANMTHVPVKELRLVMFDKRPILPALAAKLERVFGVRAEIWLRLQDGNRKKMR